MFVLACEVHRGPLVLREQPYGGPEPEPVWTCVGFEGEGCGQFAVHPVPESSRPGLVSLEKYWPGCDLLDTSQDRRVSWRHGQHTR